MRRREFVGGLLVTAAGPMHSWGQQGERSRRVGVLMGIADDTEVRARLAGFRQH